MIRDYCVKHAGLVLAVLLWVMPGIASPDRGGGATLWVSRLRCESAENPIAVDRVPPHLGWVLESMGHNKSQTAYQVLVASNVESLTRDQGDLWDSGKVKSNESVHVPYGGLALQSGQRYYWKVRVWDERGEASAWSNLARWDMGLLGPEAWRARWIGAGPAFDPKSPAGFFKSTNELPKDIRFVHDGRAVLLRKAFTVRKPVRSARVYVSGLGYYELSCNGRKVGNNVLTPAKTNFRGWVLYDTYSLAEQLTPGTNVLGVMLGNGWYNPYPKWWQPYRMPWFGAKRAILQLQLRYADGTEETVATDDSWETAPGPVLSACVYDGEEYDAREERPGWDTVREVDTAWRPAVLMEAPGGQLVSQSMPSIRVVEDRNPVRMTEPRPGVFVFDLGQNFAGWARLKLTAPRGTRVQLRYAEDLQPDGMLDVTSNERALATDVYIARGEGSEVYEPRFTFHGFQYVEVTGLESAPEPGDVTGRVVHTACRQTGSFQCDNELLNRIHRATVWAQRSNLMGYPMDCPQRDERLGWFGDAMVSMEEAMCNFEMQGFYRHWIDGIRRNQNERNGDISIISPRPYMEEEPDPAWSSAYILMNWDYFRFYGDRAFLAAQYDSMRGYLAYLGTQATNHILPKYWIGDWGTVVPGWQEGEPQCLNTALYYRQAVLLGNMAEVLDRRSDAVHYRELAADIRRAFQKAFFDPATKNFEKGTQFSNAFPLWLGLAERADEPAVMENILKSLANNNHHFDVGVLGAKYLMDALTDFGRSDVAYGLAVQTGGPSWAAMLEGGRTTLSEFWDLRGSHNHVMMGSVDGWFYRALAGIEPDAIKPGFAHFYVRPFFPEALERVRAGVETVRGPVKVEWEKRTGEIYMAVTVPVNSRATVILPSEAAAASVVPAARARKGNTFRLGSGDYCFRACFGNEGFGKK